MGSRLMKAEIFLPWTECEVVRLREMHGVFSLKQIAAELGRSAGSIRSKITKLGISKVNSWSDAEIAALVEAYEAAGTDGVINLPSLADRLGRLKSNICRKAKQLGLGTSANRKTVEQRKDRRKFKTNEEYRADISRRTKEMLEKNGHPRGMAGKKHSEQTRKRISETSKAMFLMMSEEKKSELYMKVLKTKAARGVGPAQIKRGSWQAGWREIGGKRNYYRSMWEANYARYLQWLKERGEIADWAHEPETFWFEAIKRGVRSYKPDFRVWEINGFSNLHEVKGWMDARSKTCLARMRKYHPSEKIILIDANQYRAIRLKVMRLVPGWEDSSRDQRT